MIPITKDQRRFANDKIDAAAQALADLAENGRNLDLKTMAAINEARDCISMAESLLANQPTAPR